jgi:hypothetical protein
MKALLFIFLSIISNQIIAEIKPFHISMDVGNEIISIARSDIKLEKKAAMYQMSTRTKAIGVFSLFNNDELIEVTSLKKGPKRFYPIHYQYTNVHSNQTSVASYDFDYDKKIVLHHKAGETTEKVLHDHAYDPNSMVLGAMTFLEDAIKNKKGKKLSRYFYYHDHYRVTLSKYTIGEEETLHLPFGEVKAIKIYPESEKDKLITNIWISVEKGYIPVKIEQVKNGNVELKMELSQIH